MIEHLDGREKELESLGWRGPEAEWIALVCLHSGIFTRAQFCFYFDARRNRAHRFVKTLVERRAAVEWNGVTFNGGAKACLISGQPIYRALGAENILQRRTASLNVVMRRLLSLDYVLEHAGLNWLPTEAEKVEFFEGLGLSRRLIPRRIYYGAVGARKRYFALKLPIAVDAETVTFAYVDPGHSTASELHSWGAAHGALWDALRKKRAAGPGDRDRRRKQDGRTGRGGVAGVGGGGPGGTQRGADGEAGGIIYLTDLFIYAMILSCS